MEVWQKIKNKRNRINQQIKAPEIRVIDTEGKQIGVLTLSQALKKAEAEGLDLVEVSPEAKPPVVRILDYKKYLFSQKRKGAKDKKKTKTLETKELRFGPNIGPKDLNDRVARAREFLEGGNKVKVTVQFKGRAITHPEFGLEKINNMVKTLADISEVEQETKKEGRFLYTILKPK